VVSLLYDQVGDGRLVALLQLAARRLDGSQLSAQHGQELALRHAVAKHQDSLGFAIISSIEGFEHSDGDVLHILDDFFILVRGLDPHLDFVIGQGPGIHGGHNGSYARL